MGFKPEEIAIVLEEAAQYTDSQRLAHEEKKVITWDGNTEGREKFPFPLVENIEFYLVSDNVVDLNNVKKLSWVIGIINEEQDVDVPTTYVASEGHLHFIGTGEGNMTYVVVCDTDFEMEGVAFKKGTYFMKGFANSGGYVNHIEVETVHQIDPKFIPNTVINLCDYGLNAYEILGTAAMTGEMSGSMFVDAMDEDFWKMLPRNGEPITFYNDDGQNDPTFLYGTTLSLNRQNNGGTITINIKLRHEGLKKIVNMMLTIVSSLSRQDDSTVVVGTAKVHYIIELQNDPTAT